LRDLVVILAQALLCARFRMVLEENLDQHVGVAVADRDPTLVGSLGLREAWHSQNCRGENQHQFAKQNSLLRTNRISRSCWDHKHNSGDPKISSVLESSALKRRVEVIPVLVGE